MVVRDSDFLWESDYINFEKLYGRSTCVWCSICNMTSFTLLTFVPRKIYGMCINPIRLRRRKRTARCRPSFYSPTRVSGSAHSSGWVSYSSHTFLPLPALPHHSFTFPTRPSLPQHSAICTSHSPPQPQPMNISDTNNIFFCSVFYALARSWLLYHTAFNIYSSFLCFIHEITIQKKISCAIQFNFLYVPVSTHYNIQSVIVTQQAASETRACTLINNFCRQCF